MHLYTCTRCTVHVTLLAPAIKGTAEYCCHSNLIPVRFRSILISPGRLLVSLETEEVHARERCMCTENVHEIKNTATVLDLARVEHPRNYRDDRPPTIRSCAILFSTNVGEILDIFFLPLLRTKSFGLLRKCPALAVFPVADLSSRLRVISNNMESLLDSSEQIGEHEPIDR